MWYWTGYSAIYIRYPSNGSCGVDYPLFSTPLTRSTLHVSVLLEPGAVKEAAGLRQEYGFLLICITSYTECASGVLVRFYVATRHVTSQTVTVSRIILVVRQTSNRYYTFIPFLAESFSVTTTCGHRLCCFTSQTIPSANLCVAWCTVLVTGSGRSKTYCFSTARMLGSWVRIQFVVWTYVLACAVILLWGAGRSFVAARYPL